MTKPKRKQRGVVERFLAGDDIEQLAGIPVLQRYWGGCAVGIARVEAILRRALKKKGGKR